MNNLSESKEHEISQEERAFLDRAVRRKFDRTIFLLCICFFLLASLNTVNIASARLLGLQRSLAMTSYRFSLLLTIGHVSFIVSQLPSTLLLKVVGPDLMLPAMLTLWGVISASQGFVNNYSGLLVCRLLQGLVGGGLYPCLVLYLSFFYPRERLQSRIAVFYVILSASGGLSGLLAEAIKHLNRKGGKPGWAWIFILEGVVTFVFGVVSFFFLPRSPETVRSLTEKERAYAVTTLKHAGSISDDDEKDNFSWAEVFKAINSPHVWLFAVMSFFGGTMMYSVAPVTLTIVTRLGYIGFKLRLMSLTPVLITLILCVVSAIISDRYHCRGYTVIFFSLLEVVGFTMFYASTSPHIRYASLFFTLTGAFCTMLALITWVVNNSMPLTRRATAVAMAFAMSELGGILSIWLLGRLSRAPNYTTAVITFIVMSICSVVLSSATLAHLARQNRLKAEQRTRMRKEEEPECFGDRSAWFIYIL